MKKKYIPSLDEKNNGYIVTLNPFKYEPEHRFLPKNSYFEPSIGDLHHIPGSGYFKVVKINFFEYDHSKLGGKIFTRYGWEVYRYNDQYFPVIVYDGYRVKPLIDGAEFFAPGPEGTSGSNAFLYRSANAVTVGKHFGEGCRSEQESFSL